jgi:N-acetylglucosaminyldiphosphoundecaprenol N-acetyl-beta-D-mannosaminyltransferase
MQAEHNDVLAGIIRNAELVIPDGAGVILYLRLQGQRQRRCPGIELAESLLRQAGQLGESCPVFFLGGAPGVAQQAAEVWQQQLPGLALAGVQHGYLSAEAEQELKASLKDKQPRLILVGLGVPRQELWIVQHRYLCPEATWIGVGGSFDIWAGVKSRAPGWLRDNHLEWLYRLYQEPWRWRRMMALPHFALKAIALRLKEALNFVGAPAP